MIELKNISKKYGNKDIQTLALDNLSLRINKNDFIAIMGTSGSGKSTLLNILGAMDRPSSGEYIFEEQNITNLSMRDLHKFRKKNISFVFQNFALINRYTVYENLEVPLLARNEKKRKDKIMNALMELNIENLKNKYPQNLSGGQQQRCAIARALITNSKILLCDEPTGALDKSTSSMIMDTLSKIHEYGKTIIVVTHDITVAKRCEKIISLEDGKICSKN